VTFWHQIHARRRRDQQAGKGDYSQSNIIYKFLANRGLFPQLSDVSGEYIAKTAGKLEDFLMNPQSRSDLQTPEAQRWLQYLQSINSPRIDPLTPWLTREWKKNRIDFNPGTMSSRYMAVPPEPNPHPYNTPEWHQFNGDPANQPGFAGLEGRLPHWADWYNSNHPTRRGLDVMKMQTHDMHSKIQEWDEAMAQEAEHKRTMGDPTLKGEVAHSWPDGWTVQNLTSEPSLKYEGDRMGHCVGDYGSLVGDGGTMIYSLRDPKNIPHVTAELSPTRFHPPDLEEAIARHPVGRHLPDEAKDAIRKVHELKQREKDYQHRDRDFMRENPLREDYPYDADWDQLEIDKNSLPDPEGGDWYNLHKSILQAAPKKPMPHGADVEQIQGQGNTIPKPEYQARMKEFFSQFPDEDKPKWNGNHINDYNEIDDDMGGYSVHGDYGIEGTNDYDWSGIIQSAAEDTWSSSSTKIDNIVDHATQAGPEAIKDALNNSEYTRQRAHEEFKDRQFQRTSDDDIADFLGLEREDFMKDYDLDEWGDGDVPEGQEFDEGRWEEAIEHGRDQYIENEWDHSEESNFFYDLEYRLEQELRQIQRKERDPFGHVVGSVQVHENYSTGQPCKCTFTKHIRISKQASLMPHPDRVEEARQRLNLQHPVRFLPTYRKGLYGGYAGVHRDPQTDQDSHLIYFNPSQSPGPRNWTVWHELAHAMQHERGDGVEFVPGMTWENYTQLPKEHEAEEIANKHADLDLWNHSNTKGLNVGQETQLTSQQTSAQDGSVRGAHRQAQAVGTVSGNLWTMPDAATSEADDNRPHHPVIDGWDALLR
jgi:hypothetical protein